MEYCAKVISFLLIWLMISVGGGCTANGISTNAETSEYVNEDTLELKYSKFLKLAECDGYTKAIVSNPWKPEKILATYLLVPADSALPETLPSGIIVRTPLKKSLVYSVVHFGLIEELGAGDAVKGVCDSEYIRNKQLKERIEQGMVNDCGSSFSPNVERVMELSPDAILLSPYEDLNSHEKIDKLGLAIIECADYAEVSPLARTEWMKFYGRLYGKGDVADSLFREIETKYNNLKFSADVSERPKVLFDRLYGQSWYVPGENSTMSIFVRDAGGKNPFDSMVQGSSAGLSGENVLLNAGNADYWLVRYAIPNGEMSLDDLGEETPLYRQFDAFKNGRVYGCNTAKKGFFDEVPFHPEWFLEDLISILHPELSMKTSEHNYFTPMQTR